MAFQVIVNPNESGNHTEQEHYTAISINFVDGEARIKTRDKRVKVPVGHVSQIMTDNWE